MMGHNEPSYDPDKTYKSRSDIGRDHSSSSTLIALPVKPGQLSSQLGWDRIGEQCSKIIWDQQDWIPQGYVTMLVGESGIGKSNVLLRIAGCYTDGWVWLDGSPFKGRQGRVVWVEGESAQLLNHNRACEMNINHRKLLSLFEDPFIDFNFEDPIHRNRLEDLAYHDSVASIFIDSLSGIHKGDENSTEMNNTIKYFAELARNSSKAFIITHHLKKKNPFEKSIIQLDRIRGSSSIVQNARIVIGIDQPDQNSDQKRLFVIKSNLSLTPDPIGFTITSTGIEYKPIDEKDIKNQIKTAEEFLFENLSSGPVEATEIKRRADDSNISERTLDSAKKNLQVKSLKSKEKHGKWCWQLPESDIPSE